MSEARSSIRGGNTFNNGTTRFFTGLKVCMNHDPRVRVRKHLRLRIVYYSRRTVTWQFDLAVIHGHARGTDIAFARGTTIPNQSFNRASHTWTCWWPARTRLGSFNFSLRGTTAKGKVCSYMCNMHTQSSDSIAP